MGEYVELSEVLGELSADPGEVFLQFDLEEEDCYRTLMLLLSTDPESQVVMAELIYEVAVEKPEEQE